jgi:hypothetical protein
MGSFFIPEKGGVNKMSIAKITADSLQSHYSDLLRLLWGYETPFSSAISADREGSFRVRYFIRKARDEMASCFAVYQEGGIRAAAVISPEHWDSRHFIRNVSSLSILYDRGLDLCNLVSLIEHTCDEFRKRQHVDIMVASTFSFENGANLALQKSGFMLSESRNKFFITRKYDNEKKVARSGSVIPYRSDFRERLLELSREIDFPSRFYNDHLFSSEKVRDMYEIWVDKAIRNDDSIIVLIVDNSDLVGFGLTEAVGEDDSGEIIYGNILAGAIPGKGYLTRNMFQELTRVALSRGTRVEAKISSSNTVPANIVLSAGYRIAYNEYIFHKHFVDQ